MKIIRKKMRELMKILIWRVLLNAVRKKLSGFQMSGSEPPVGIESSGVFNRDEVSCPLFEHAKLEQSRSLKIGKITGKYHIHCKSRLVLRLNFWHVTL
jgi:hypothetical protein